MPLSRKFVGFGMVVLEDKSRRGALAHLSDLASIWPYRNDQQIKQICYCELTGHEASYEVTIWRIDPVVSL